MYASKSCLNTPGPDAPKIVKVKQHTAQWSYGPFIRVHFKKNEFMVEIYSKSVIRAIGKVFPMKLT